MLGKQIVLF